MRAVVDRIVDRLGGRARGAAVAPIHELEPHDLRAKRDAGHAVVVVGPCGDGASDVGAVRVVVVGVGVAIHEVVAADVIDVAVPVVVHTVAGDLAGVAPQVGDQVRVADVHARVDDGDHDPFARGQVPRRERVDVGPLHPTVEARVVQTPQVGAVVVHRAAGVVHELGLCVRDGAVGVEGGQDLRARPGARVRQDGEAIAVADLDDLEPLPRSERDDVGLRPQIGDADDVLTEHLGVGPKRLDLLCQVAAGGQEEERGPSEDPAHR